MCVLDHIVLWVVMRERLQKILARTENMSRRGAERLIVAGEVTVNGELAQLGDAADPAADDIRLRGRRVVPATMRHIYVALHKPLGVVSSMRSTHGEPTVADLVPLSERLFPVGRLDKNTSGLLLMTNDGGWALHVLHPRYGVSREYRVWFKGILRSPDVLRLRQGVRLEDGSVTSPAEARIIQVSGGNTLVELSLVEGKKRQIRMMGMVLGHPVVALHRVRFGCVELGDLPAGKWRFLTEKEIVTAGYNSGKQPVTPGAI